jgi:hypothetical protein
MVKKGWPIPAMVMAESRPCREWQSQPEGGGMGRSAGVQIPAEARSVGRVLLEGLEKFQPTPMPLRRLHLQSFAHHLGVGRDAAVMPA